MTRASHTMCDLTDWVWERRRVVCMCALSALHSFPSGRCAREGGLSTDTPFSILWKIPKVTKWRMSHYFRPQEQHLKYIQACRRPWYCRPAETENGIQAAFCWQLHKSVLQEQMRWIVDNGYSQRQNYLFWRSHQRNFPVISQRSDGGGPLSFS